MTENNTPANNFILLNNVRLSFPSVFEKKDWKNGKEPRYEATFILDKDKHKKELKLINDKIDLILAEKKVARARTKLFLNDGDLSVHDEYQNSYTVKATSFRAVPIVGKDLRRLEERDNLIYAGCYVNAEIDFYFYKEKSVGIGANFYSMQYCHPGERLSSVPPVRDITGVYQAIPETEEIGKGRELSKEEIEKIEKIEELNKIF